MFDNVKITFEIEHPSKLFDQLWDKAYRGETLPIQTPIGRFDVQVQNISVSLEENSLHFAHFEFAGGLCHD